MTAQPREERPGSKDHLVDLVLRSSTVDIDDWPQLLHTADQPLTGGTSGRLSVVDSGAVLA